MDNTLLYSPSELTMLRANKQAQRQLDVTCRQIEQEKRYISKDWNNRMSNFVVQKKKVMPKGWDHSKLRLPTAWGRTPTVLANGVSSVNAYDAS